MRCASDRFVIVHRQDDRNEDKLPLPEWGLLDNEEGIVFVIDTAINASAATSQETWHSRTALEQNQFATIMVANFPVFFRLREQLSTISTVEDILSLARNQIQLFTLSNRKEGTTERLQELLHQEAQQQHFTDTEFFQYVLTGIRSHFDSNTLQLIPPSDDLFTILCMKLALVVDRLTQTPKKEPEGNCTVM